MRRHLLRDGQARVLESQHLRFPPAAIGFAVASAPIIQYVTSLSGSSGKGVAMSGLVRQQPPHQLSRPCAGLRLLTRSC